MRLHRDERGLTLVELILSAFILSTLALALENVAVAVFRWVDAGSAGLRQSAAYGRALQLLSQDLRQPALAGISIGGSTYNAANAMTLDWTDRTTTPVTSYAVSYLISGTDLVRQMTRTQGATVTNTTVTVARDLDPAGASGGAEFSRAAGAPGVVRALLTVKVGASATSFEITVEQRP